MAWASISSTNVAKGQCSPRRRNSREEHVVPAAVAHCPYDPPLPREWAARQVNLVHFTEFPRGGHFMAWEEPELYVKDIQDFVSELRG